MASVALHRCILLKGIEPRKNDWWIFTFFAAVLKDFLFAGFAVANLVLIRSWNSWQMAFGLTAAFPVRLSVWQFFVNSGWREYWWIALDLFWKLLFASVTCFYFANSHTKTLKDGYLSSRGNSLATNNFSNWVTKNWNIKDSPGGNE